jgi:hypothetical protein
MWSVDNDEETKDITYRQCVYEELSVLWHDDWRRQPLLNNDWINMCPWQQVHTTIEEVVGNVFCEVHADSI